MFHIWVKGGGGQDGEGGGLWGNPGHAGGTVTLGSQVTEEKDVWAALIAVTRIKRWQVDG